MQYCTPQTKQTNVAANLGYTKFKTTDLSDRTNTAQKLVNQQIAPHVCKWTHVT